MRRTLSNRVRKKFIMQINRILVATLLSFAAVGAMSQELDRDHSTFVSTRTRAAVEAEAQNARASGQWVPGGDVREAAVGANVDASATTLTRQDVKNQVAAARAAHQLPRIGELM